MNGVTTTYTTIDGVITSQNDGTNLMYFRYDGNGSLTGFNLNGTEYVYVKNLQGDITGILDMDSNQIVSYTYDAWGRVESISGTMADTVGAQNPMRYRGYYEDTETGLYYLQSRYYDAGVGRFVSVDEPGILKAQDIENSLNLHEYGNNNPIINIDPSGRLAWSIVGFTFQFGAVFGAFITVQWVLDLIGNQGILITVGALGLTPQVSLTWSPAIYWAARSIYNLKGSGWIIGGSIEYIGLLGVDLIISSKGKLIGVQFNFGVGYSTYIDLHGGYTFSVLIPVIKASTKRLSIRSKYSMLRLIKTKGRVIY